MRNIELKARLDDLAAARAVAVDLATNHVGVQEQVDMLSDRFGIGPTDLLSDSYSDMLSPE